MSEEKPDFLQKKTPWWWLPVFVVSYALILLVGFSVVEPKASSVDDCSTIVNGCAYAEVLEDEKIDDIYEKVDQKPTLGGYVSFTYEILTWGNVTEDVATFSQQANQTLNDSRGWKQAGISFAEVESGGSFSLVLSQAEELDKIGGCSSAWSCRSGRYVIINQDRWAGATDAWNGFGGSLRDYRHMVVNHEVGHWLGLGHYSCSAPGNLAYVMQQQSINLGGCQANPWPLLEEIEALP